MVCILGVWKSASVLNVFSSFFCWGVAYSCLLGFGRLSPTSPNPSLRWRFLFFLSFGFVFVVFVLFLFVLLLECVWCCLLLVLGGVVILDVSSLFCLFCVGVCSFSWLSSCVFLFVFVLFFMFVGVV